MDAPDFDRKDVRRPMNAFLIFCKRHRSIVREKNPSLDNRSVTRILGDLWANLGDDEKSQYTDLAKQYKDAFMKANPDYKWHNPEKVVPPTSNKPNTRPTNMRLLKPEHEITLEGAITPGKLADPSNMGGLSLLLESAKCSTSTSYTSGRNDDKHFMDSDSSSSDALIGHQFLSGFDHEDDLYMDDRDDDKSEDTELSIKSETFSQMIEDVKEVQSSPFNIKSEKQSSENDENGNKYGNNYTGQVTGHVTDPVVEKMDPITGCGQRVMDHIIERLYNIEQQYKDQDKVSGKTEDESEILSLTSCSDEVDGVSKMAAGVSKMAAKTEPSNKNTKDSSVVKFEENKDFMKFPLTPQKSFPKAVTDLRKRKRCYSEGSVDTYESTNPIEKKVKLDFDGNIKNEQDSEKEQIDLSGGDMEFSDQSESLTQDDKADQDSMDEESNHPIRKSKRRNRGQRYQELINEGIIQPSKERLASMKGDTIVKEESVIEDNIENKDTEELAEDVLSVYPRQIRKRAVSESEKSKPITEDGKRYKTGDFDLEAQIATLPACSLEKVARNAKRSIIKVRHHSDTGRKSDTDKSDVILALPVPPHLKLKNVDENGPPKTGSQKRKARKHSVNRLIPVSSSAGISLVAVKTDDFAEQTEQEMEEHENKIQSIAESILNCEKVSDASKQPSCSTDDDCFRGNQSAEFKNCETESDIVETVDREKASVDVNSEVKNGENQKFKNNNRLSGDVEDEGEITHCLSMNTNEYSNEKDMQEKLVNKSDAGGQCALLDNKETDEKFTEGQGEILNDRSDRINESENDAFIGNTTSDKTVLEKYEHQKNEKVSDRFEIEKDFGDSGCHDNDAACISDDKSVSHTLESSEVIHHDSASQISASLSCDSSLNISVSCGLQSSASQTVPPSVTTTVQSPISVPVESS